MAAITKRKDRSPKEGESKYGNVEYADPVNKAYPIDDEEHIRAAWSYINKAKNAAKYKSGVSAIKARIIAAWKKKIDKDGPPSAAEACYIATCDNVIDLGGEAKESIMYLPAGKSTISAAINGEAKTVDITVTAQHADLLNIELDKLNAKNVTPFLDFNHEGKAACGWPKQFRFEAERGIYLDVDWSGAGKRAVAEKDYKWFSPQFMISGGKPVGLPEAGSIGGLTNDPAFRQIEAIAASRRELDREEPIELLERPETTETKKKKPMSDLMAAIRRLGIITAECDDEEQAEQQLVTAYNRVTAENNSLRGELLRLKSESEANAADLFIEGLVQAGRVEPHNDKLKGQLKVLFLKDSDSAKAWGESLPVKDMSGRVVTITASHVKEDRGQTTQSKAALCAAEVTKMQKSNPGLSFNHAWKICAAEQPALFGKAA